MKKDVRIKIGSESVVDGANVVGNLVIATGDTINYLNGDWVAGVDESNGFVIIGDTGTSNFIGRTTGGGTGLVTEVTPTFWKSSQLTDQSLLDLINKLPNSPGNFETVSSGREWLTNQGYWASTGSTINFVTGLQTYTIVSTLVNDPTQWAITTLDYTNEGLTVTPLGFTTDDWYHDDSLPLNESGYIHVFVNNSTNYRKLLFVDASNNIVQTVELGDGSLNYDSLSGKIIVANYVTTGDIYYFDGLTVYQYSYDVTDLDYSEMIGVSSNGVFFFKTVKFDGSIKIVKLFQGVVTTIIEYNVNDADYEIEFYNQGNFYTIFKKVNNIYQEFKIKSISENTELQMIEFSGFTKPDSSLMQYTTLNYNNYGSNKFVMVFHNWDDAEVDYRVYTYNGTTDVLNAATHVKGANYPQFSVSVDDNSSPDNYDKESVILTFYSNGQWTGSMNLYQYVDLIYQMEWQTTLSTYTFTNTGSYDAGFDVWNGRLSNNYHGICTTNNVDLQILSITEADGLQITTVGQLADLQSYSIEGFGNKACFRSTSANDGTGLILKYFGDTGTVLDELIINGGNPYTINTFTNYNSFAILHDGIMYYINTTTDEIVQIGAWANTGSDTASSYYEAPPAIMRSGEETVLFNQDTYETLIIKPNSYAIGSLPAWDTNMGYDVRVGKNSFMYVFGDLATGFIKINLYDFNLTLLNSITTDLTNYSLNTRGIKDRFVVRHNDGQGNYRFFMITPNFGDFYLTPTSNVARIENDWIYWN